MVSFNGVTFQHTQCDAFFKMFFGFVFFIAVESGVFRVRKKATATVIEQVHFKGQ